MNRDGMSDSDLIELVQTQLPQDLSDEQVQYLRQAMRTNSELREVLFEELRLETGLASRLAPERLGTDDVVDHIANMAIMRRRTRFIWLSCIITLGVGMLIGTAVIVFSTSGENSTEIVAKDDGDVGAGDDVPGSDSAKDKDADGSKDGQSGTVVGAGTGDNVSQADKDDNGEGNGEGNGNGRVERVAKPMDPKWRLYDDPSARIDDSWMARIGDLMNPQAGATLRPNVDVGSVQAVGLFRIAPPAADGTLLRWRPTNINRFNISLWNDGKGVHFEYVKNGGIWKAYTATRKRPTKDYKGIPFDVDPMFLREHVKEFVDSAIDFTWPGKLDQRGVPGENFAIRWTGKIRIPVDGKYRFIGTSDDGMAMSIDGKRVFSAWVSRAASASVGEVDLKAGAHDLVVEYFQATGPGSVKLEWESSAGKIKRQVIPESVLSTEAGSEGKPGLLGRYCFGKQADVKSDAQTQQLFAEDDHRWRFFRHGAFDLRYQDGHAVLSRGKVVLVAVPMESAPKEAMVDVDAKLMFAGQIRLEPLVANLDGERLDDEAFRPAGSFDWLFTQPDREKFVTVLRDQVGPIRFTPAKEKDGDFFAGVEIDEAGGAIVEMALLDIADTSGIFYTDPSRNNGQRRFFFRTYNKRLVLCHNPNDAGEAKRRYDAGLHFGETMFVRFTFGINYQLVELSDDRQRWLRYDYNLYEKNALLWEKVRFGLGCYSPKGMRGIGASKVSIMRPAAMAKLVDMELSKQVPDISEEKANPPKAYHLYLSEMVAAKPKDVAAGDWSVACNAAILAQAKRSAVRTAALFGLIKAAAENGSDVGLIADALKQLPRYVALSQIASDPASWKNLYQLYNEVGQAFWADANRRRIGELMDAWYQQRFGLGTQWFTSPSVTPVSLTELALYQAWSAGDWEAVRKEAMRFDFMSTPGNTYRNPNGVDKRIIQLSSWMGGLANRNLADGPGEVDVTSPRGRHLKKTRWSTHPLAVSTDRETQNTVAEFLAAVESGAYEHACRLLTRRSLPDGIAPVDRDNKLFKAMHVLIRQMIDADPKLAKKLKNDYERIGLLRLQQAIQNGQLDSLEPLAVQFHGTAAASEALKHLADRDLVMGNFFAAASRYEKLAQQTNGSTQQAFEAKRRLALAMTGQDDGALVTRHVRLGGKTISAKEFEQLISTLVDERAIGGAVPMSAAVVSKLAPLPTGLKLDRLAELSTPRDARDVALRTRQIGWVIHGQHLVLHQHGRLSLIDLNSKRVVWRKEHSVRDLPKSMGQPATPIVVGGRVFLPMFRDRKIELSCFDFETGMEVWHHPIDDGIVGDPMMIGPWLYVLTIQRQLGDYADVILRRVSPETGGSLLAKRVVRVRYGEELFRVGPLTQVGDALLFRTANSLVCCDLLGGARWIRRLSHVPIEVDSALFDNQPADPMVVDGARVIVNCPGSPHVVCVDVETGRQVWSCFQPTLRHVVGRVGDKVVLNTASRMVAVDLKTGEICWQRKISNGYSSALPAGGDTVFVVTLDKRSAPSAALIGAKRDAEWLSGQTGQTLRRFSFDEQSKDIHDSESLITDGQIVVAVTEVERTGGKLAILTPIDDPNDPMASAMGVLEWGAWYMVGPFKGKNFDDAFKVAFGPEKGMSLKKNYAGGKLRWKKRDDFVDGKVHQLSGENAATYLYREVSAEADRMLTLSLGSDDSIRVWVNGREELSRHISRGVAVDQERITVRLKKGKNTILMKIVNGASDYGFYFQPKK